MKTANSLIVASATAVLLSACGGGSSSDETTIPGVTTTPTTAPTISATGNVRSGKAEANFVAGNMPRFVMISLSKNPGGWNDDKQATGTASPTFIEADTGAALSISLVGLSGAVTGIEDIAGSTNWALGRWSKGTMTDGGGAANANTLVDLDHSAHYFFGNTLAALPTSGVYNCAGFHATSPSLLKVTVTTSGVVYQGVASSSSATLSFGPTGGALATTLVVTAGSASASASYQGTIGSPTNSIAKGNYFGTDGALLALYEGGAGKVQAVQSYRMKLDNGVVYQGIATWTCSPV